MTHSTRRSFLARAAAVTGLGAAALTGCNGMRTVSATARIRVRPTGFDTGVDTGVDAGFDTAGRDRFLTAVRDGDEASVRRLLDEDATLVDATDDTGRSALVLALCGGHDAVVEALLEHDPQLGLVEAVMIPEWDRAMALIDEDPARLEAWHPVGGTALYAAARAGRGQLYRLQLAGAHADGNPRGRHGVTPAYGAMLCASPTRALCSSVDLLSNGAHVNAPQRGGDSLLHAAARRGEPDIVRYLLRRGADTHALDARGRSPLRLAEVHGHEAAAQLLRHPERVPRDDMTTRYAWDANGAPIEWPDLSDLTREEHGAVTGPAHFNLPRIQELVDPDPRRAFARSTQDELAVEAAGHTGHRDGARYLLDHGVPMSLCTALSVGDLDRTRAILLAHPGAIHERGPHDFAPMFYAAIGGGNVEAAELLLAHGCDVDQESQGSTALHESAARGHVDLAAFLLEKGAALDAVGYKSDRAGWTPLQTAQARGGDAMVRFLKERGAR